MVHFTPVDPCLCVWNCTSPLCWPLLVSESQHSGLVRHHTWLMSNVLNTHATLLCTGEDIGTMWSAKTYTKFRDDCNTNPCPSAPVAETLHHIIIFIWSAPSDGPALVSLLKYNVTCTMLSWNKPASLNSLISRYSVRTWAFTDYFLAKIW